VYSDLVLYVFVTCVLCHCRGDTVQCQLSIRTSRFHIHWQRPTVSTWYCRP